MWILKFKVALMYFQISCVKGNYAIQYVFLNKY